MRITLCREAGGLGDAIRMASVGRTLQDHGHVVTIITQSEYTPAYSHIMNEGLNLVTVDANKRRQRDELLDAKRFPYLSKFPADQLVDLYCPAFREESELGSQCVRDRLEIFASAAGVEPEVHRWNVTALERAEAAGYLRATNPTGKALVALHPICSDNRRNWPTSNWQYVIDQLNAFGHMPLVFNTKYSAIRDFIGCRKIAGLPIELVAAIFESCACAVMPDSAQFHLANFLCIPTIGIFGSSPGCVIGKNYKANCVEPSEAMRRAVDCDGACWGRPTHGTCITRRDAVEGSACPAIQKIDKELVARLSCGFARNIQMPTNRNRR